MYFLTMSVSPKMATLVFIHGGKVVDSRPIAHFLLRLEAAVDYYRTHYEQEQVLFLVSGRWTSVTEEYPLTEAEVGKRWIEERLPDAKVYKEDISVELIGNYAFSKPIIEAIAPNTVIIPTSLLLLPRSEAIARRIFHVDIRYELLVITEDLADNDVLVARESNALYLFEQLFDGIADGDDTAFRDRLLYKTPYYTKGIIDDPTFFNQYWRGGFNNYLQGREIRSKLN